MKIDLTKEEKYLLGFVGVVIVALPYIFTRNLNFISFTETGSIGDTIGGITAPFLSFFGSILVYLALKSQIDANNEIKRQFKKQEINNSNDFIFSNYKERINMIISEINSFNISFHDGTLISNIKDIPSYNGKKYNFIGIQALNLYLIEYFRLKKQLENDKIKKFKLDTSYHSIFLNINNLILLFYKTHTEIINCSLDESYKSELEELLKYTYYSKLNYFLEIYSENDPEDKLNLNTNYLYSYYKLK